MKVTYQADSYSPERIIARYVKRVGDEYRFCEVGGERRYDLRQGTVEAHELPDAVRAEADQRAGRFPAYVNW
jgi:hypothetical protein